MYGLNRSEIISALIETTEQFYSHLLRCPVFCEITKRGIIINKYNLDSTGYSENSVILKYTDIHNIANNLQERFESLSLLRSLNHFKSTVNTALTCCFVQYIDGDAHLLAESSSVTGSIKVTCNQRDIPPHERGQYKKGKYYWMYVKGIKQYSGKPELQVSRTSIGLVEALFRNKGDNVKCIYRVAGAKSHVRAKTRIKHKHIISISNELRERIIVEF